MSVRRHRRSRSVAAVVLAALGLAGSGCGVIGETSAGDASGRPIGATASIGLLTGTTTTIKLDGGFTAFLRNLKVRAGSTGRAKLTDAGAIVLPITGGSVSLFDKHVVSPYVVGIVFHDGSGLSLAKDDKRITLSNLILDPAFSRVYGDVTINGGSTVHHTVLFELDGQSLEDPRVNRAGLVLQGTQITVSEAGANALDKAFRTKAVHRGMLVGVATIRASPPPAG